MVRSYVYTVLASVWCLYGRNICFKTVMGLVCFVNGNSLDMVRYQFVLSSQMQHHLYVSVCMQT